MLPGIFYKNKLILFYFHIIFNFIYICHPHKLPPIFTQIQTLKVQGWSEAEEAKDRQLAISLLPTEKSMPNIGTRTIDYFETPLTFEQVK